MISPYHHSPAGAWLDHGNDLMWPLWNAVLPGLLDVAKSLTPARQQLLLLKENLLIKTNFLDSRYFRKKSCGELAHLHQLAVIQHRVPSPSCNG